MEGGFPYGAASPPFRLLSFGGSCSGNKLLWKGGHFRAGSLVGEVVSKRAFGKVVFKGRL